MGGRNAFKLIWLYNPIISIHSIVDFMDSLAKLIHLAQITGSINVLCEFQGSWFVHHPRQRAHGMIHFVTHGQGWLKWGDNEPKIIQTGDLIILPRSVEHILSSDAQCDNRADSPQSSQYGAFTLKSSGSGESELRLFCANFDYEPHADLFDGLPEMIYLNGKEPEFQHILALLQTEAHQHQAAAETLLNALLQVLLIHILRRYFHQQPHVSGILNGLQDKRLRGVIGAVLAQPALAWSVEQMSEQAHLSRAQLMRLFKQHVGMSPHAFVNRIRLQAAAQLLRQTADSVLQIALSVGFQSETHFGKAFKKQYSIPPGSYRKSVHGEHEI